MATRDTHQPLTLAGGDTYGRAMFFRFGIEEWEREKDSLIAFLNFAKVKENNASG